MGIRIPLHLGDVKHLERVCQHRLLQVHGKFQPRWHEKKPNKNRDPNAKSREIKSEYRAIQCVLCSALGYKCRNVQTGCSECKHGIHPFCFQLWHQAVYCAEVSDDDVLAKVYPVWQSRESLKQETKMTEFLGGLHNAMPDWVLRDLKKEDRTHKNHHCNE